MIYFYDGWQCIEEREWDNPELAWKLRRRYTYGSQYIDEPVPRLALCTRCARGR